ncbi:PepSY domain-containing protein [Mycoplana ramosa]|uniref:PepSY domain-containing protein n=1 Tax=Mycoplana ramosa TaxID=40837 RepID=A0ABW3Z1M9_MYCRA
MKKTILFAAIVLCGLGAGAVMADDDDDNDCNVPMTNWQPREAVQKMAEGRGWTIQKIKTDDGCYKIRAQDKDGRNLRAKVNPGTLDVVSMKYADDRDRKERREHEDDHEGEGERNRNNTTSSGTATPPNNGLFGSGTPPKVQVQ